MRRWLWAGPVCLLWMPADSAGAQAQPDFHSYDAVLVVDTVTRLLTGEATLVLTGAHDRIELAASVARVDGVSVDGASGLDLRPFQRWVYSAAPPL